MGTSTHTPLKEEEANRWAAEESNEKLQVQLERSRKMESLGVLAGGVAHDLNNILSATINYPELILMDLPENHDQRKRLEIIRNSGLQAAEVVQDLLTLARRGIANQKVVNLNDIAENYILVFWSSGCSHCLKEIPQLYQLSQELNSTKYKIIAVGLEEDDFKWKKEILKYPNFINVIKLKKWSNTIVNDYGLTSTPTYFVLDKDKKFIEKPENFDALKAYLKK